MKIDSTYKPNVASTTAKQATPSRAQGSTATQDAVSLSQLGGTMNASEAPPVNSARIQEIKQAITEGRFQINADAIANSLIDSAKDLVRQNKNQA